jgi:hypothetical protein
MELMYVSIERVRFTGMQQSYLVELGVMPDEAAPPLK